MAKETIVDGITIHADGEVRFIRLDQKRAYAFWNSLDPERLSIAELEDKPNAEWVAAKNLEGFKKIIIERVAMFEDGNSDLMLLMGLLDVIEFNNQSNFRESVDWVYMFLEDLLTDVLRSGPAKVNAMEPAEALYQLASKIESHWDWLDSMAQITERFGVDRSSERILPAKLNSGAIDDAKEPAGAAPPSVRTPPAKPVRAKRGKGAKHAA